MKEEVKNDHTKIYTADLDSPRRELSARGLGFAVTLSVHSGIVFQCASNWGSNPALAVQLDCPSVIHWDYVINFVVEVRFQIRNQFWIPQEKLHGGMSLGFLL